VSYLCNSANATTTITRSLGPLIGTGAGGGGGGGGGAGLSGGGL
jgi:hypothetical protein